MDEKCLKNESNLLQYQVINTQQVKNGCFAIAINHTQSLILMAQKQEIIIGFFKQGVYKLFQTIKQEMYFTCILHFQTQKLNFITSDGVSSLKIWSSNLLSSIKYIQKLRGHKRPINCLHLNNNENLIITGSNDQTIKSWNQKNHQWSFSQTIMRHKSHVNALCINRQGDKFISCARNYTISVFELSKSNQTWAVSQIIQVDKLAYIIGFICDSVFVYQPIKMKLSQNAELNAVGNDSLYIYQLDHQNQYIMKQQLQVSGDEQLCQSGFPFFYCSKRNTLLIKNGSQINLIKAIKNDQNQNKYQELYDFQITQVISFEPTYCKGKLYGTTSLNGQYIIISNFPEKIIEIRELKKVDNQFE